MPTEFRFLVFSPEEAAAALTALARKSGKPVPAGRTVGAEPVGEKTNNGRLLVDTGDGAPSVVPFTAAEVLDALIGYCLERRIPMPMVSEKTIERISGRFALRIGQVDSIEFQMRTHLPRG